MKTLTRLEDYLENAPMSTKIALAAAGTLMAALVASSVMATTPARAVELHTSRTAPIVHQLSSDQASELSGRDTNIESGRLAQIVSSSTSGSFSQLGEQADRPGVESVHPSRTAPIVDQTETQQSDRTEAKPVHPDRVAPIVEQSSSPYKSGSLDEMIAIERMRPMANVVVEDVQQLNKMNERTSSMLRDVNDIATRLYESKAWSGDTFTPEQKAKNIATALKLAQNRAGNPDVQKLDGYIVTLRADVPENRMINNVTADLNFKREILRDASLELNALIGAMKENRQDDVEKHRATTETILKDAGYALNANTDWSLKTGQELAR